MSDSVKSVHDPKAFRQALGAFATGVTIVTTRHEQVDVGITANSFNSVSLDPPMVLWSLSRKALSLPAFQGNPHFAVHILASDQEDLSRRFASQGADKFAGLTIERGPGNVPMLEGCSARFQCRTTFTHDGGDHVIFVGQVLAFDSAQRPPLVYHAGRYALAIDKTPAPQPDDAWSSEPDTSFSRDFLIYLLGRAHFQMFHGLRADLDRYALSEEDWFVLSLLGVADNRSIASLDRLLWLTGSRVTYERIAPLAAAGLVSMHGGHDPATRVSLTERGRATAMHLMAAAKAVESHAERNLGPAETFLLKNALRRLIRDSDPSEPPLARSADD
jgi:3-hydroxy-9,10-secoandrosta-1,3,5(10)-triene-9,17-dione monooxygenase reductase component